MRSRWDRWAIPQYDVDLQSSKRHVAGELAPQYGELGQQNLFWSPHLKCVRQAATNQTLVASLAPALSGAMPQSRGAMMRELHSVR